MTIPNWQTPFQAFANIVQFYPKLTASVALGAMAAFGRMLPSRRGDTQAPAAPTRSPKTASPTIQRSKAFHHSTPIQNVRVH